MNSKKSILLLGKLPPPYMGPSVAFEILINSKLKEHYNLFYLDIKANDTLDTLGKWSFQKMNTNISFYRQFISSINENKPDLTLIPISQSKVGFIKDSIFIWLASLKKRKTIVQLRGGNFLNFYNSSSYPVKKYINFILKKSEGVIVLGNNLRYLFENFFPNGNIHVIPNGGKFNLPDVPKVNNDIVKIIYVGNLQPSKGIEDVIKAVELIKQSSLNNFCLDVIGKWRNNETKNRCFELVNEKELPVNFHDQLSGELKLNKLLTSDIFVFTPREPEGHPWVIIEAMAACLPIISTDKGAITESVKDGINGFIVESSNPKAIADKLKILINDSHSRERMGTESRKLYEDEFTEEKMIQKYINTFDSIISKS